MKNPVTGNAGARHPAMAAAYAVVLLAAFWLLFYHLDNHLLWGDEAETGVLAKNVLQFGVPKTFDGTNYILLHGPMDETKNHVWTWSPWLQEYVAASSFLCFGATTWAARAPFALIGWASLVLVGLVAFRIFRKHSIALAAIILLASSELFLLHARQCRYYPISVFAEILLVYGVYELFAGDRRSQWLIALALVLQFYSNYIIVAANLPALLAAGLMLRRDKAALSRLATAAVIFILAALPWILYAQPWSQGGVVGHENYFLKACGYLAEFHFHFIPFCFLLLPLIGWLRNRGRPSPSSPWECWLLALAPMYFVVIVFTPGFYLRYLLPVLPVGCMLLALWLDRHVTRPWIVIGLVAIQSCTNFFAVASAYPVRGDHRWRAPLVDYVQGARESYANRLSDALEFFQAHARAGERVLSFDPELPLIFYTKLGIIDGRLAAPPEGHLPEWVLGQSASAIPDQPPVVLPDFLSRRYETITVQVHHSPPGDSIPDPDRYQYRATGDRSNFVIYKRKTENKD